MHYVVRLTKQGERRVLEGVAGMTFVVDSIGGVEDRCRHVRDYRYGNDSRLGCQIWTLGQGDWEELPA